MLIIKNFSAYVEILKEDSYYLLCSLQKYMESKGKDKDYVPYYNDKRTNIEYWGEGYKLLCDIVNLPPSKRHTFDCVLLKEHKEIAYIFYYYKGKEYYFEFNRKYSAQHKMIDRLNEIFEIENEDRKIFKKWKYLKYVLS